MLGNTNTFIMEEAEMEKDKLHFDLIKNNINLFFLKNTDFCYGAPKP